MAIPRNLLSLSLLLSASINAYNSSIYEDQHIYYNNVTTLSPMMNSLEEEGVVELFEEKIEMDIPNTSNSSQQTTSYNKSEDTKNNASFISSNDTTSNPSNILKPNLNTMQSTYSSVSSGDYLAPFQLGATKNPEAKRLTISEKSKNLPTVKPPKWSTVFTSSKEKQVAENKIFTQHFERALISKVGMSITAITFPKRDAAGDWSSQEVINVISKAQEFQRELIATGLVTLESIAESSNIEDALRAGVTKKFGEEITEALLPSDEKTTQEWDIQKVHSLIENAQSLQAHPMTQALLNIKQRAITSSGAYLIIANELNDITLTISKIGTNSYNYAHRTKSEVSALARSIPQNTQQELKTNLEVHQAVAKTHAPIDSLKRLGTEIEALSSQIKESVSEDNFKDNNTGDMAVIDSLIKMNIAILYNAQKAVKAAQGAKQAAEIYRNVQVLERGQKAADFFMNMEEYQNQYNQDNK